MRLIPMTAADYEACLARQIAEYAADHVRAGNWTDDEAEAKPSPVHSSTNQGH